MKDAFIDSLTAKFMETAREIAAEHEHQLMMVVLAADGTIVPVVMPPVPQGAAEREKDIMRSVAVRIAKRMKAIAIFTITEAFISTMENTKPLHEMTVEDERRIMAAAEAIPKSKKMEVLLLSCERSVGTQNMWVARIGTPDGTGSRKIGPWETMGLSGSFAGRFTNMLDHEQGEEV